MLPFDTHTEYELPIYKRDVPICSLHVLLVLSLDQ
jgi:hypothetical protein